MTDEKLTPSPPQKVGVVALTFEVWRAFLEPHVHSQEDVDRVRAIHHMVKTQIAAQSFHANCKPPTISIKKSPRFPSTMELHLTCDCGETLSIIDNIPPDDLQGIGPRGAFRPTKDAH
jgi:hypothetical protein